MSIKSLKKQKDTLESMIKKFRSTISDGKFVNISELEEAQNWPGLINLCVWFARMKR